MKLSRFFGLLAPMLLVVAVSGCSVSANRMYDATGALEFPLDLGEDYEVIGDAVGKVTMTRVLGISLAGGGDRSGTMLGAAFRSPGLAGLLGRGGPSRTEAAAVYDAINSVAGADALIFPRFDTKKTSFPILFSTESVTVRGKAIRLKTASE